MEEYTALRIRKNQTMAQLRANHLLAEINAYEHETLLSIIEQAFRQQDGMERWKVYSELKRIASGIVGRNARHQNLSSSEHYYAMLRFIDWMLPDVPDEDEQVEEVEEIA